MATDSKPEADVVAIDVDAKGPSSPKKRKRRTPTAGAADDCFSCQDSHATCDRRRPYCTQCIERGKTCSGYKTTLTWGVGVASRGKLRGLTLPVAKGKKSNSINKGIVKKPFGVSKSHTPREPLKADASNHLLLARITSAPSSMYASTPTTFGFVSVDPNASVQSPESQGSEDQSPSYPKEDVENTGHAPHSAKRSVRRHSLEPMTLPPVVPLPEFSHMPMTANAVGGYMDPQYEQAMDLLPATPMTPTFPSDSETTPMLKRPGQRKQNWSNGYFPDSFPPRSSVASWPSETMSSSLGSDVSSRDFIEDDVFVPEQSNLQEYMPNDGAAHEIADGSQTDQVAKEDDPSDFDSPVEEIFPCDGQHGDQRQLSLSFTNSMPSLLVGGTRALRELINYYDQVISPVIVAFDGPTNPYRMHILRLASESDCLQHAIAALSASNLRMRRDYETVTSNNQQMYLTDMPHETTHMPHETTHDASVRKSSIAHNMLRDSLDKFGSSSGPGQPSQRELYHKGESIRALNAKLGDPSVKDDDSVLATLLVLCLYHVCDTGVAKFRTQFAGVKKILALRNTKNVSKESRWLITMFKWFDAMTATVNDREGQFEEDTVDYDSFEIDEWSLENLAGCDARLFKIISKLGRLNLLSQGKSVNGPSSRPRSMAPRRTYDFYSMSPAPVNTTWSGTTQTNQAMEALDDERDPQTRFAVEWQATRQELLDWQFDASTIPMSMLTPPYHDTNVNALDLNHISESFRYSALLYTERLANPSTPSSAPNFQSLVAHAILHIQAVKSDVFLLWPLFVTGTESVLPEHRELVRKRCLAIQEDSGFFNNMSTLTLLERIWEDADREMGCDGLVSGLGAVCGVEAARGSGGTGPFKWRKAMGEVDGEYIVI